MEEPGDELQPLPSMAVIGINFGALIIYLAVILSNNFPDSLAMLILLAHLVLCLIFAINTKRPAWWISVCIVAFPMVSLLTTS